MVSASQVPLTLWRPTSDRGISNSATATTAAVIHASGPASAAPQRRMIIRYRSRAMGRKARSQLTIVTEMSMWLVSFGHGQKDVEGVTSPRRVRRLGGRHHP